MPSSRLPVWGKRPGVDSPPLPQQNETRHKHSWLPWVLNTNTPPARCPAGTTPSLCSPNGGWGWNGYLGTRSLPLCQGFPVWAPGAKGLVTPLEALTLDGIPMHLPIKRKKKSKVATPFKLVSSFLRTPPEGTAVGPALPAAQAAPRRVPERRGPPLPSPARPVPPRSPLPRGAALPSRRLGSELHVRRPETT